MGKVIRPFCWHQNFVPKGLSAPALGLYTCTDSLKNVYKIICLKLSDKMFLLTSKFCPQGVVCPCPRTIYMYKIFWKLATNDQWWGLPVDIKFGPSGLSAPARLYTCIKSWKMCIKSESKDIFLQPVIKVIRPFCSIKKNCPQGLHVWNKTKYHIK